MSYLDRLKNLDSGKRATYPLQKLQKPPFYSFCSSQIAHFQKCTPPDFDREHFEERAGILEYDAGIPRHEAERLAMMEAIT